MQGVAYLLDMPSLSIDPRKFIGPPFTSCPKCERQEFGALTISKTSVTRRCRECWHTETQVLPALHKKIVYLDQMVYSGMAKTLDPVWAAASAPQGGFWGKAFDALERAFKLQLIVCPNSTVHEKESALASQPPMLRALYEHLGNGTSFQYPVIIHQQQLSVALRAVLQGEAPHYDLRRGLVMYGDPDEWMDRLRISVNLSAARPDAKTERGVRDRSFDAMLKYFEQWQTEKGKKFDDWYRPQRQSYAVYFAHLFNQHNALMQRVYAGEIRMTEEVVFPRLEVGLLLALLHVAKDTGEGRGTPLEIVSAFLFSDAAYDAPANDTSALLLAAVARKAASGQRRPPSPGMWNDIVAISSFLPYCDAMFLDNECAGLMREEPLKTKLGHFGTRIFSSRTGDAFLEYLDSLERHAGADHVRLVAEVYGDDWSVPYRELLIHAREREARHSESRRITPP